MTDKHRPESAFSQPDWSGHALPAKSLPSGSSVEASGTRQQVEVVARGGMLTLVGIVASGGLQFLLVILITRGLGTGGAGLFFEAIALFTILSNMGKLGADTGLVRTISRYLALRRASEIRGTLLVAFLPVLIAGTLLGLGVFTSAHALVDVFIHGFDKDDAVAFIQLLAPFIPLASASTVALAATRGFGTMVPYVAVQNIALPAIRALLVTLAITLGLGSTAVSLSWGLPLVIASLAASVALVRLLGRSEATEVSRVQGSASLFTLASRFWRFAAPRGVGATLGISITWLDILLVGALRTAPEAGIYAAASRLISLGAYVLDAIGMAVSPQVSTLLARGNRQEAEVVYQSATCWLIALTWPFYLTLALFSPFLLRLFGPEFVSGAPTVLILSLAMLVNIGTGNVSGVLLMAGKSSWNLFNALVSLTLNLILNLILIPRLGITGAAIAWAVSIVALNGLALAELKLLLHLRPFGPAYLPVSLGAAICYGATGLVVEFVFGMTLASVALFGFVATASYILVLWRFHEALHLSSFRQSFRFGARGKVGIHPPDGSSSKR